MRADVSQNARARQLLGRTPARQVPAERHQVGRANAANLAKIAALDQVFQILDCRREVIREGSHMHPPGALSGVEHLPGLGGIHRQRLFAQHVLAGLERGQNNFPVKVVRDRHDDSVDIAPGKEPLVIAVRNGQAQRLGCLLDGITTAHDLDSRAPPESRQMDSPRHRAGADQADSDDLPVIHKSGNQLFLKARQSMVKRVSALYRKWVHPPCANRRLATMSREQAPEPAARAGSNVAAPPISRAAEEGSDRCESGFQGKPPRPPAGFGRRRIPMPAVTLHPRLPAAAGEAPNQTARRLPAIA